MPIRVHQRTHENGCFFIRMRFFYSRNYLFQQPPLALHCNPLFIYFFEFPQFAEGWLCARFRPESADSLHAETAVWIISHLPRPRFSHATADFLRMGLGDKSFNHHLIHDSGYMIHALGSRWPELTSPLVRPSADSG